MTVHNPMPFELKVSNVVSDVYRLFNVFSFQIHLYVS